MSASVIPFWRGPVPKPGVEAYFGICPDCGGQDGCLNIGSNHWFYCNEHRTAWCFGSNIFSAWRDEPASLHAENERRLRSMRIVDAWVPPEARA